MKRLKNKKRHNIKECTPLFYKNCACCEYQYKRETMWKTKVYTFTSQGNLADALYICKNCMPERKDVEKYLDKR